MEIPELTQILDNQDLILNQIKSLRERELPEWIDLKTACEYKGIKYTTVGNRKKLKPDESKGAIVSGKMMWPRDVIIDWIKQTDDDLGYEPEPKHPKLNVSE